MKQTNNAKPSLSSSSSSDDDDTKIQQLTPDGGVQKEILIQGKSGELPKPGALCKIHYTGTLESGKVFDSSLDRDPFEFTLGEGSVIKGWDIVAKTMKKGEKSRVVLKSEYAYGEEGSGDIPPGATLIFEMEMIQFCNEKDLTKGKDKGVMKVIMEDGEGYLKPNYESSVVVSYVVKVSGEDEVVEEVSEREFKIGEGELVQGLEIGLESMKSNERAVFTIQPHYGYGSEGNEFIPADATLVYDVKLHSFEKAVDSWNLKTYEEKMEAAEERKEQGNKFFADGKYDLAVKKYERAMKFLDSTHKFDDEQKSLAKEFKLVCHLNTALVYYKQKDLTKSLKSTNEALKINDKNIKALYRRALINIDKVNWKQAKSDLNQILLIDPQNNAAIRAKRNLKQKIDTSKAKEKAMFSKIFREPQTSK